MSVQATRSAAAPGDRTRLAAVLAVSLVTLGAMSAQSAAASLDGGDDTTSDLKSMSLKQLMDVEVTTVSRYPQTLLRTPSATQVITQEQIRRSGAASIPEALRLADNLDVAQKNSHDWAISARGFNTALANKLLVMIDGRTVYTPLFSGVFWDVQDYLLADLDRIEVVSGPGGTLWGANAVNGVIDIVTKNAAQTHGLYIEAGGGSQLQDFTGARYGGELADGVDYRIYGKFFDRGSEVIADGSAAHDSWHQGQGGFRVDTAPSDKDTLSAHGDFYGGHENEETGDAARTDGGNIVGQWGHIFSSRSDIKLQAYYDHTHLSDPIPALLLGPVPLAGAGVLEDDLSTYDLDFQHRFAAGERHRLVWGLGYRFTHDVVSNAPALGFFPAILNQNLYSAFLQDEIALRQDLTFTIGSKTEYNDYTGFEFEPNVRLQWSLTGTQSLWGAISRAVRTPSRVERDASEPAASPVVLLRGAATYGSEYVTAYEAGYRLQLAPTFTASVSTFYNDYTDVRSTTITPVTLLPFYFANDLEGHTYGVELSGNYQLLPWWTLHGGYDWLREHLRVRPGAIDINDALNETSDPENQLSLRSSMNLPSNLELDGTLRWVDALQNNNGPVRGTVPGYFEFDTRLGWQLTDRLELSLVGQNLLHDHHPEYGFPTATREEIQRSIYAKVVWHY